MTETTIAAAGPGQRLLDRIADIAIYPWVARHEWHRVDLAAFPNVKRWYDEVGARPAVQRGMAVPTS